MALLEQKVVAFAVSPSKTAAPWFKLLCFFVAQTTVAAIGALGVTTFVVFVKFEAFSDSWILTPKVAIAISVRFVVASLWRKPHKGRMLSSRLWRLSLPFPTSSSSSSTCFSSCSPDSGAMPATADFHFFPKTRHFFAFFLAAELIRVARVVGGSAGKKIKQKWLCAGIAAWSKKMSLCCFGDFGGVIKVTWCYFLVQDLLQYKLKLLCLREGFKKKTVKKRSGWPLGLTPPSPPPKRSGKCENFSTSCHIWGYFVVL